MGGEREGTGTKEVGGRKRRKEVKKIDEPERKRKLKIWTFRGIEKGEKKRKGKIKRKEGVEGTKKGEVEQEEAHPEKVGLMTHLGT